MAAVWQRAIPAKKSTLDSIAGVSVQRFGVIRTTKKIIASFKWQVRESLGGKHSHVEWFELLQGCGRLRL